MRHWWFTIFLLPWGSLLGRVLLPTDLVDGELSGSSFDGLVTVSANSGLGTNGRYFGVKGGSNQLALDDLDGLAPAEEVIQFSFSPEVSLEGITVAWTRGELSLTGFSENPLASVGSYNEATGTWVHFQSWTERNEVSYHFENPSASAGRTLTLTVADSNEPNPQVAITAVEYDGESLPPLQISLVADASAPEQTIESFGASLLWTIDPTEGWPEKTKEELALKLVSQAGGIGLSGLRFDFGGGNPDTGTRTSEPYTWRFPEPLKDSAEGPFDWSRREGQQWFLRRSRDLGLASHTLASISPPWWMTKNGLSYCSSSSGTTNIEVDKMGDYATYLADVIAYFRETEGVTFDLVSPINEPEYDWEGGGQEGNRGTAEDIRNLVIALHSELEQRNLTDTKIEVGDHATVNALLDDSVHTSYSGASWNQANNRTLGKYREYLTDLTSHPEMVGKISPVASYHSYFTDSPSILNSELRSLLRSNASDRGVDVAQTEYCILGSYGPLRDLQIEPAQHIFRTIHKDLAVANAVAWSWWLALSPHDFKDGLIYTNFRSVLDTAPKLFDSKIYFALGHFSRFIRPGWKRIDVGEFANLQRVLASGWLSPNGEEVALVVANFSDEEILAKLPTEVTAGAGSIREWHPWVTDRGRSLRRETAVTSSFPLAPNSFTTLVGRVSENPFRLATKLEASSWSAARDEIVALEATATWEDGCYLIPALDETASWVFQRPVGEARGLLLGDRYWVRRKSDGSYLGVQSGVGLSEPIELSATPTLWDVLPLEDGRLRLREVASGRTLQEDGRCYLHSTASVLAQARSYDADFHWLDGLGTEAQSSFEAVTSRWVAVESRLEGELARQRAKIRVGATSPSVSGLEEKQYLRWGESITLSPELSDPAEPWVFRLVPERDDLVVVGDSFAISMQRAQGMEAEQWTIEPVGGGEAWLSPQTDVDFWLRSADGLYLQLNNPEPLPGDEFSLGESPAEQANWRLQEAGTAYRLIHQASGLAMGWSNDSLVSVTAEEAPSFYLDALIDEPLTIHWSHGLGSGVTQTITPQQSDTYSVHIFKGGVSQSLATEIVVQRSFAEWSELWFGELVASEADHDGDGAGALYEYATGSNPLDQSSVTQPVFERAGESFGGSWPKNPEAIGSWIVEESTDLKSWTSRQVATENEEEIAVALEVTEQIRRFVRLRFTAAP